jgi:hypothetical protein
VEDQAVFDVYDNDQQENGRIYCVNHPVKSRLDQYRQRGKNEGGPNFQEQRPFADPFPAVGAAAL